MKQGVYIAFDYGEKRVGLAHTDPLQIIASALDTLSPKESIPFLKDYMQREKVVGFVVGKPTQRDGTPASVESKIQSYLKQLQKHFPEIPVFRHEERYTSKMAAYTLHLSGVNKKRREDKSTLDRISATLILQSFLDSQKTNAL
ncbi:MAG: Holliday junction resolvase RuvX [Flavobacteriaceae bacterium]